MKKNLIISIVVVAALVVAAVMYTNKDKPQKPSGADGTSNKIQVFTSIVPQEYFLERIGGERVEVQALVKSGSSPATYEPSSRQMADLSEAALFFRIGVPFENVLMAKIEEIAQEELLIIDTREGIELREMEAHHHHHEEHHHEDTHASHHHEDEHHHHDEEHHHEHDHEEHDHGHEENHHEHHHDGHHHEGGKDPHIWLSPRLVKVQARTIADALIAVDPAGKEEFEANLAAFIQDLDALDTKLEESLAPAKGKTFMVFHPSWGYLADDYGLHQEAIEVEGKDPSGQRLAKITEMAKEKEVGVIFVQPQFSMKSADSIAEAINAAVVPIDPLERDYLANMEKVAETISKALKKQQ